MTEPRSVAVHSAVPQQFFAATAFVCVNCARPGKAFAPISRSRPVLPDFGWPFPVREIAVPCAGRLQPEHVLRAFELGASVVCLVACVEDTCEYLEGSKRCARRAEYLRSILKDIGLGAERLLLFELRASAAEDVALQAAAIRHEVVRTVTTLPQNPLHGSLAPAATWGHEEEADAGEDDNDE
jgi:F420-non-reducing hydrogenase iron-sulfur subunit